MLQAMRFALGLATAVIAAAAAAQQDEVFPARPVRIVVTSGAGGSSDLNARILAPRLAAMWGQPVVIDNRPGGGFVIGTELVARAAPTGHTLLVTITNVAQHPATRKDLPYDVLKDLAPISRIHLQQLFFLVDARLPVKSLTDLIAYAKANPGKLNFASYGNVSTAHMFLAKLNHDYGTAIVHVAYNGVPPAVRALVAGDASVGLIDLTNTRTQVAAGRLRVLASTGANRSRNLPDVPTFEESGVPGFAVDIWAALFAPGGTPEPVLNRIAADYARALEAPEVQEWYRNAGVEPVANTPAQFRESLRRDIDYWAKLVQSTGMKVE